MGKLTLEVNATGAAPDIAADHSLLWTLATVFVVSVFVFAGVWAIATALT